MSMWINANAILNVVDCCRQFSRRSSCIIKDVHDVCERNRESLVMVLSNMCVFGDPTCNLLELSTTFWLEYACGCMCI